MTADGPQQLTGYRLRDYDELLATLRRAWIDQRLRQADTAAYVDCTRSQIANILRGRSETPGRRLLDLIHAHGYDLALIPREDTP